MPSRPRPHRLADASRLAFERQLPETWLYRVETPDYGIDGQVEIFDEQGTSTGLRFFVQLKATDQASTQNLQVRLRNETVSYYGSLDLPVMLALYHAPSTSIFIRWLHHFDPYYGGRNKNSISLRFSPRDAWDVGTAEAIHDAVVSWRALRSGDIALPVNVGVTFGAPPVPKGVRNKIITELHNISGRVPHVFRLVPPDTRFPLVTLLVDSEEAHACVGQQRLATLHIRGRRLSAPPFGHDATVLIGMAFAHARLPKIALPFALAGARHSSIVADPNVFWRLALALATESPTGALELSRILVERFGAWPSDAFVLAAFSTGPSWTVGERSFYLAYRRDRLAKAQESGDAGELAMAHYNLGNAQRHERTWRAALRNYRLAGKHDPLYRRRDYYWRELGGICFEAQQYRAAARFYRRAYRLRRTVSLLPLLADALLHSGEYSAALALLKRSPRARRTRLDPEEMLTSWMLETVVDRFGILRQSRDATAAEELCTGDARWSRTQLRRILRRDALCVGAWFQFGVALHERGAAPEAAEAFAIAGLLDRQGRIALQNSLALAIGRKRTGLLAVLVAGVALKRYGHEFFADAFPNMEAWARSAFLKELETVTSKRPGSGDWVVRNLGSNGRYSEFKVGNQETARPKSVRNAGGSHR